MFRINVLEIMKEPGLSKTIETEETLDIAEVDLKGMVYSRLKFTNASSRIIVNGYVRCSLLLDCCRCLDTYEYPMEFEFCEEFLPSDSEELIDNEKLSWEDLSRFTYDDNHIDIYEMLRQNILSEIPNKPLCSEDCIGICPECGRNLNNDECGCDNEVIDPRLLPFLKFKSNSGNK